MFHLPKVDRAAARQVAVTVDMLVELPIFLINWFFHPGRFAQVNLAPNLTFTTIQDHTISITAAQRLCSTRRSDQPILPARLFGDIQEN